MATTSEGVTSVPRAQEGRVGFFQGRKGMQRRESILAYLFLLPALLIIGLFGLFPLIFSIYQSTRAGLNNIVGRPDGFGQYVRAIDSLAYVGAFFIGLFFFYYAYQQIYGNLKTSSSKGDAYWVWLAPGALIGLGLAQLARFIFLFMPGLLEVGEKLSEIRVALTDEERNELFLQFLGEAWQVEGVSTIFWIGAGLIIVGIVVYQILENRPQFITPRSYSYFNGFIAGTAGIVIGLALIYITYIAIGEAIAESIEDGEPLPIWSQVITISTGFLMFLGSWVVWTSANGRDSNLSVILRLFAAALLMVGGWILIRELPAVIAEGKSDWWSGLAATTWYVVIALPFQLFFGILFAALMYQEIRGRGFFRMVYFLPYITPIVGSAAAFQMIFTGNPNGLMNVFLNSLGFERLQWLAEPAGIFELMGANFGLELPGWAGGPSLALIVAIMFGVWRYTGYYIVFFLAGLGNISKELYEAASIDGASRWAQFRNITLPLLSPTTYFLTIVGIIGVFQAFTSVWVLRTGQALGTMDTASIVIFEAFNRDVRYGYASALGVILLIIILIVTATADRLTRDRVFYE